jgi:hypothetical protein
MASQLEVGHTSGDHSPLDFRPVQDRYRRQFQNKFLQAVMLDELFVRDLNGQLSNF